MLDNKDTKRNAFNRNVWLYSPGSEGRLWDACLKAEIMCVGWQGNLEANFAGLSIEEIRKRWNKQINDGKNHAQDSRGIHDFLNVMNQGDIVFVKKGIRTLIGWGIVTSDPFYIVSSAPFYDDEEWKNFRRVKWIWKGEIELTRGIFPQKTLTQLKGTETYYKILKNVFTNNKGVTSADKVLDAVGVEYVEIETDINQTLNKATKSLLEKTNLVNKAIEEENEALGDLFADFVEAVQKVVIALECASVNVQKNTPEKTILNSQSNLKNIVSILKWECFWAEAEGLFISDIDASVRNSYDLIRLIGTVDLIFDQTKAEKVLPREVIEESYDPSHDKDYVTETPGTVHLRRGQDLYRSRLMGVWHNACAVTGITNVTLLRASHAIPWSKCESAEQRLNPHNGLLLSVSLDALFDQDLICFEDDGRIRISSSLDLNELEQIGVSPNMKLREIHPENIPYLQAQRKRFEAKENAKKNTSEWEYC